MKVICEGLDLSDAVLKVIKAAAVKPVNPVLEGIKLKAEKDTLILTATDTELSIEKRIKADVKIEGEAVVPGRIFADFVRKINYENIEITVAEDGRLKIKYIDSEGVFQCYKKEEFPLLKAVDTAQSFTIIKKELKDLISKIAFSAALDDARPILKGILLEIDELTLTGVALDGFRLALCVKPIENSTAKMSAVIPAKSLTEIAKLLDDSEDPVTIYIQKNYLLADLKETRIVTRLLEGDFINYKQILPKDFTSTVTVNRAQIEDGIDRASLLARGDKNNLVKFDIKENLLILTSHSEIGNIREKVAAGLEGKDIVIAFNAKYFSDVLRNLSDEFIKIKFISPVSPCIVTGAQKEFEYTYLILPVRIIA
ncbi:DNA polymerase III subunit beta [Clostridia bacterium]|nr:DNA polymerase III subunit beta [Clostridia bacterium]